jgi:hypothetical protein
MLAGMSMKTCIKCGEAKPLTAFSKSKTSRDGAQPYCKTCASATTAKWAAANRERKSKNNRNWKDLNPDKKRAHGAKWVANHPDKNRAKTARRRAAETQATPPWVDHAAIAAVYAEQQTYIDLGVEVHVDHIVPLRGENVCGLHVPWNLRVILAEDNLRKNNKLDDSVAACAFV